MDDKTLTAKAEFLVKEARLDAAAFRENTVYNADGDAIRLIANAERLEQYADTIEAQATRIEALEAALRKIEGQAVCVAMPATEDEMRDWLQNILEAAQQALESKP